MNWISPLAYVAPWVQFGEGCVVHPFAVVGRLPDESPALARRPMVDRWLVIGARTIIGCHATVFSGSQVGEDTLIGDFAHIREGASIGNRCVIGRYVAVGYDSSIEDDCRLQDRTVFFGLVGRGSFFGIGVVTSNDRNVNLAEYQHSGATPPRFGKRVLVGSGANILPGVTVGDDAVIGAGAIVVDDVAAGDRVLGQKARTR